MDRPTRVEQFNSLIRGSVLSLMTAAFCYKFLDGTVSTDAFISIFAGVLGWWFATRGGQTQQPIASPADGSAAAAATPSATKP